MPGVRLRMATVGVALLFAAANCAGGGAQEEPSEPGRTPLDIEATTVHFQMGRNAIIFGDGVKAEYQGTIITADSGAYDTGEDTALFTGHITLKRENENVYGEKLFFDFKTRTWELGGGTAVLSPDFFGGQTIDYVYVTGKRISGDEHSATVHDAVFTSCSRTDDPHWGVHANTITLDRDGKRIRTSSSRVKLGDHTFLILPSFSVSRSLLTRANLFPQVGQNNYEGYFVRWSYQYGENNLLRLGFTERQGNTYGTDYDYRLGSNGQGNLSLSYLTINNSFTGTFNHRQRFGSGTNLAAGYDLRRSSAFFSGTSTTQNQFATFTRNVGSNQASLNYRQSQTITDITRSNTAADFRMRQNLAARSYVQASARFTEYDLGTGAFPDQEASTRLEYQRPGDVFDFQAVREQRLDLDGSRFTNDNAFSSMDRLPEVQLMSDYRRLGLGSITGRAAVTLGEYLESPRRIRRQRLGFDTDFSPQPWSLGSQTRLNWTGIFNQRLYSDDTAIYVVGTRATLTTNWSSQLKSTFGFNFQEPKGFTPYRFDFVGRYSTLTGGLNLATPGGTRLSLITSHDNDDQRFTPLRLNYSFIPSPRTGLSLSSGYDLEADRFTVARLRFSHTRPGDYRWDSTFLYDPVRGRFTSSRASLDWQVLRRWRLQWLTSYNGIRNAFDYNNIRLSKDFHDFVGSLTFNSQTSDIRFNFAVKAFPGLEDNSFGIGSSGELLDPSQGGAGLF